VAMESMLSMQLGGRSSPRASRMPLEDRTPRFSETKHERKIQE
jgi:hypothetical protein